MAEEPIECFVCGSTEVKVEEFAGVDPCSKSKSVKRCECECGCSWLADEEGCLTCGGSGRVNDKQCNVCRGSGLDHNPDGN